MASREVQVEITLPVTADQVRAARVAVERAAAWRLHTIGDLHQLYQGDTYQGRIPGVSRDAVQYLVDVTNTVPGILQRLETVTAERDALKAECVRLKVEARRVALPFTSTGPIHPEKSRGKYR